MRRRTFLTSGLAALAPDSLVQAGPPGGDEPHRRLFLDALAIARQSGLQRVFHAAEKYPGNPIVVADKPWEIGGSGPYLYGTVLREGGKFRMWYHFISGGYRNAYAESADGIHWTKPELGLIEFQGSRANNLFLTVAQDASEKPPRKQRGQCHNPNIIPVPGGRPERYALFCYGADYDKVRVAFSPDGLRWKFSLETAIRGLFESSDVVNFFYDPYQRRYVATWKGSTRRGRSVGIATSADGLQWTKPAAAPIFTADDLDPPDTQVYGMPVFPYQGLYIGLPWIYHAWPHYAPEMLLTRAEAEAMSPCQVDVQMAWSWDLLNWTRPPGRKPFLPLGPHGSFDSEMIYTARAPVEAGDRLYFYYGGFDNRHNARNFHGAIGLATLRLDGFCSMRAGAEGGWLITRREKLTAPRLAINAATTGNGSIRAELLDLNGDVIPGFSGRECRVFRGDAVRHVLRWPAEEFPDRLRGAMQQIRFHLADADLYSYVPVP